MKKFLAVMVCILVVCFSQAAFAADEENLLETKSSSNFVSYSAAIGTTSSSIICKTYSLLIEPGSQSITMYLQKWNGTSWITVESWNKSSKSLEIDFSKTYPKSSGKYRIKGKHSASGETKYSYSPTKTIN